MVLRERRPRNCPWNLEKNSSKSWTLSKSGDVFTFTKSKIDGNYIYVQKNEGKKKPVSEYEAGYTYQRLFDSGYELGINAKAA
tara:strand:+ start:26115 stop:26363 length:249 start_codon:yes stop_codon:yes gene_type:complete